jgi:hypothetical protein
VNVTATSQALVSTRGLSPVLRRQRNQPVAATTVVFLRAHYQAPAGADQRLLEIDATHAAELNRTGRDAGPNAQVALYELIQGDDAGLRKGAHLDVFA